MKGCPGSSLHLLVVDFIHRFVSSLAVHLVYGDHCIRSAARGTKILLDDFNHQVRNLGVWSFSRGHAVRSKAFRVHLIGLQLKAVVPKERFT